MLLKVTSMFSLMSFVLAGVETLFLMSSFRQTEFAIRLYIYHTTLNLMSLKALGHEYRP
jgi:hypothetical protein